MAATARKSRRSAEAPKVDAYQVVTDQVIAMLEAGVAPWRKPWDPELGMPRSMSTGKTYRGINPFLLQISTMAHGYASPFWGTYKHIAGRGGQVRKGERGTQIILWKTFQKRDAETDEVKTIPVLRTFTVFNADQVDGDLSLPVVESASTDHDPIAECDAAVTAYLATDPVLRIGGSRACYSPSSDVVSMPERRAFETAEEYYGALFHELAHSTGHQSRLNRPGIVEDHFFGDELYSKEELVAELTSAFLAGMTGIATVTLDNSASYLASWIKVLKGDKKMIVSAAGQAQKAADMLLGVTASAEATVSDEDAAPVAVAVAA